MTVSNASRVESTTSPPSPHPHKTIHPLIDQKNKGRNNQDSILYRAAAAKQKQSAKYSPRLDTKSPGLKRPAFPFSSRAARTLTIGTSTTAGTNTPTNARGTMPSCPRAFAAPTRTHLTERQAGSPGLPQRTRARRLRSLLVTRALEAVTPARSPVGGRGQGLFVVLVGP